MCAVFDTENLVTFGLFDEEGLAVARSRIDEAYDVLLDPNRRRPYEISVFPGGRREQGRDRPGARAKRRAAPCA